MIGKVIARNIMTYRSLEAMWYMYFLNDGGCFSFEIIEDFSFEIIEVNTNYHDYTIIIS